MATQIGSKGAELDLLIRQGATFGPHLFTLRNPDTSPVNITGCTFFSQLRKTANDPISTGALFTVTVTNAAQGQFTLNMSADLTRTLTADVTSEDAAASKYYWDLEMTDVSSRIIPIAYGVVKVFREVSKV